ncbi:MAG: ATP-binding cassette domain-containing protein [Dysgonamonadaceae bacterium]|jgi:molybdate transport system ATP-binding protein|nr:ATP-binding cassette domain-containing protein [Dysgonamonadaceae bacterium]
MTEDNKTLRELISVTPINSDLISARLSIKKGEQWAFIGPNGCGKTFLSSLISGKIRQNDWQIEYDFISKRPLYENVKVLQFKDIYTVSESGKMYYQQRFNSAENDYPPVSDFLKKYGDEVAIHSLSVRFGIEDLLDKPVIQLSSGELRKVHIIRVLLGNPEIIILDNPYIGLDVGSRILLDETLQSIINSGKTQIILLLSDPSDLPQYITNVLEINKNNGYNEKKSLVLPEESLPTEDKANYENVIEMEHINIQYGGRTILKDLNWTVKRGEKWALLGENGSGKSTLLSLVCADNPQGYANSFSLFGRKRGSGESIWEIKRRIGYVSPEMHFYFNLEQTCIEVVASGFFDTQGLFRKCNPEQLDRAWQWIRVFGAEYLAEKPFLKTSFGEQRLILLVRAFVKNPDLLVLDEPFHGLDKKNKEIASEIIENYCRSDSKTFIFVSHYEAEILPCISLIKILKKQI